MRLQHSRGGGPPARPALLSAAPGVTVGPGPAPKAPCVMTTQGKQWKGTEGDGESTQRRAHSPQASPFLEFQCNPLCEQLPLP